ncbi:unnamed protein product [Rotaria sp. Silwood1]|nr:unnamed protein product [Rotaria sp. Silwood1]CAF0766139.1 unnamed protein product [Rotaria sp. Silwood1]CAF0784599.1 unnamed protein product [Rotaria sp. Silwood1]CAF3320096.1 unnamed protein product [Rotaria sp. Silwood1]CAF3340295.1 unnamed protein product [Rotaria sp. Silwood1]
MPVKAVSDGGLKEELEHAGDKLVLVDFFATWCGPCKMVAPTIENLSNTHPNAIFLKVDVDECQTEAQEYEISAMPTFVFILNKKELERIRGADTQAIEATLAKYYTQRLSFAGEGHSMLDKAQTDASSTMTESDRHKLEQAAKERFGNVVDETMTTIRLRLPDIANPVNIRLSVDQTLNDIRHLLCNTITLFETTPFEFIVSPATKLTLEDENKTINEAKLMNAVITIKKLPL